MYIRRQILVSSYNQISICYVARRLSCSLLLRDGEAKPVREQCEDCADGVCTGIRSRQKDDCRRRRCKGVRVPSQGTMLRLQLCCACPLFTGRLQNAIMSSYYIGEHSRTSLRVNVVYKTS